MIKVQETEGQIITDFAVYHKRPADSDLLAPSIQIHKERLGRAPDLAAADAAFLFDGRRKGSPGAWSDTRFGAQP